MHAAEAKARPSLRPKRPSIFRAREVGTLPLASVCAVAISRSMCVQLRTAGLVLPGSGRLLLSVSAACLDRPWLTMAERRLPAPVFVYDIKDPRSSSLALSLLRNFSSFRLAASLWSLLKQSGVSSCFEPAKRWGECTSWDFILDLSFAFLFFVFAPQCTANFLFDLRY